MSHKMAETVERAVTSQIQIGPQKYAPLKMKIRNYWTRQSNILHMEICKSAKPIIIKNKII